MKFTCLLVVAVCVSISGCAPTAPKLTGPPRAPIPVEQVMIYDLPPANAQDVALLHASSHSVFSPGGPGATDKVVQRLKVQAAELGANGLVLQGFSDAQTASLGTGVGSESYGRSSAVGVGASGSFGVFKKTGEALAIFVPAREAP
ncbi:MAG TPA: hypothetical protein VHN17_16345 [Steroidobacteraceae bacterium]|nr:hypothetical protein [Steroidobacteraceae bacterium]